MIAGWQVLSTRTFLSMADYWQGGLGVPAVADGAARSYLAALLAILPHSLDTIVPALHRPGVGGDGRALLGLAVSWSRWTRRLFDLPVQFLRTLPLLAMVPLFQLWFGTYFIGKVAVRGLRRRGHRLCGHRQRRAATSRRSISTMPARSARAALQLYRTVVLPAIFPELRATILLSLGAGWAPSSAPNIWAPSRASATSSSTRSSSPISTGCS